MSIPLKELAGEYEGANQAETEFDTGYQFVDEITNGLLKGDLFVIAARPSMFKSILVNNIVEKIARKYRVPIGYFYEDGKRRLYRNMLCLQGKVTQNEFDNMTTLNDSGYIESKKLISESEVVFDFTRQLTLDELSEKATNFVNDNGAKLLVIDSLDNIYVDNGDSSNIIPFLKDLAAKLNVPIIVTCNLNRKLEDRENKHPRLTDLDNYRIYDNYADSILFLYRESVYNDNCEDDNNVMVVMDKTRTGILGTTILTFNNHYLRLE